MHGQDDILILDGRYAAGSCHCIGGNFRKLTGTGQIYDERIVIIGANLPYRAIVLIRIGFGTDRRVAPFVHDVDHKGACCC